MKGVYYLRWLYHEGRFQCGQSPTLFPMWNRFLDPPRRRKNLARPDKPDLVMEGFGGSANSFAWWALRSVNPEPRIGHHLHVPANVLLAVRYQIPCIVIIRPPQDSVVSLFSRGYIPSIRQGLRHYCGFHRAIQPVMDQICITTFDAVTQDMGKVIEKCNSRLGTNLIPFHHNKSNELACRQKIRPSSQPNQEREIKKHLAMEQLHANATTRRHLEIAEKLYQDLSKNAE